MNNHFELYELYVFLAWTPGTVASLRRAAPHMTNINESDIFSSMRDTSGWTMWEITYNYTFVHRQTAVYVQIFYYHHGIGFCVDSYYIRNVQWLKKLCKNVCYGLHQWYKNEWFDCISVINSQREWKTLSNEKMKPVFVLKLVHIFSQREIINAC